MPYKHRRACPICGKPNLLNLSGHLRQVHGLWGEGQRQPWLKQASHHPLEDVPVEQYPVTTYPNSDPVIPDNHSPVHCLETQSYPDFAFQHPYSMMVVGPSQCGKTHFIHKLLTHKCTTYPDKKSVRVVWCYNQWQPQYDEIRRDLESKIWFRQGLPEVEEDLSNIPTSRHTIIVLDDLMAEAKDSPVVSKLFTQGRHRNASVILLLQNMFPKGKYNTDISRNATYKVLFRSPGDRKQIDIMADQTFAKARPRFMQAYHRETVRPYGYIVVDNHPRTTGEHQVVANVLGDCYTYPHITASHPEFPRESLQSPPPLKEQLQQQPSARKRQAPVINQSEVQASKKPKTVQRRVPVKKRKFQNKSEKQTRKQPSYDSSEEDETSEEEGLTKEEKKRLLKENWLRFSEQEDTDSEEGEGACDESDPEEGEEHNFRSQPQWRGGPGRIVYEDADVSPEQANLKHAFYNPHLYPPMRCGHRGGGFGPRIAHP